MAHPFERLLLATEHSEFDSGTAQKLIGLAECPVRVHVHNPAKGNP